MNLTIPLLTVSALCAGCLKTLPPATAPARVLPDLALPSDPPPRGHGRVAISTTGTVPSVVHFVEGASFAGGAYGVVGAVHVSRLCITPCVVDLPYGNHELRLSPDGEIRDSDPIYVAVAERPSALRVDVGRRTRGGALATTASALTLLGVIGTPSAGIVWAVESDDPGLWRPATLGSVAALALGVVLWQFDRPTVQHASSTQWTLGE